MLDEPIDTNPSVSRSGSSGPMGAPEPSRSRTLLAYCDDVMRCMCATGSTPVGGIIPVEPLDPVDPVDPLGPADDPLDPLELPGMLELPPVDAGGLPVVVPDMLPVQPEPDAIKPAK